jgi:hypothetical protein
MRKRPLLLLYFWSCVRSGGDIQQKPSQLTSDGAVQLFVSFFSPRRQSLPLLRHYIHSLKALLDGMLPAYDPLKLKLGQGVSPFLDLILESNKTGEELLQWLYNQGILSQGAEKDEDLRGDVQEALEASTDPLCEVIPDSAYAQ